MYIIDFFKSLVRRSNIPVLIYLIINVIIITVIVSFCWSGGEMPVWQAFLAALVIYSISLTIALSPVGEWLLRLQTGCKKIKRIEQIEFLEPIFSEVYSQAKQTDPSLPDDIQLYINDDEDPNAFATGRKTICITRGLLEKEPEQIKATLAHEFGHLSHKDTDQILVVTVGNMLISGFILFFRAILFLLHLIMIIPCLFTGGDEGIFGLLVNDLYHLLISICITGATWLWTKIGVLLVMKTSRNNEFEADEFAYRLGYGEPLCYMLDSVRGVKAQGLFANLASSHPDTDQRIARLQELGVNYRNYYCAR
ncbi:MAG: M48 family metalloprotease [Anaerolineaceae bacterium]|nr:M48 family metalloprotease [Anaerolineaceae bacterium]